MQKYLKQITDKFFGARKERAILEVYSEENLSRLIDEYELVSKTIGRIFSTSNGRELAQRYGNDTYAATLSMLRIEKAVLESKIETLQSILNK